MGGVGRDVATLVVGVDGHVQAHQLDELGIIVADHLAEVGRPVKALVNGWGGGLLAVQVVVDDGGDGGQVGDAVHAVLVDVLPVGGLVDTVVVSLGELGLGVHEGDGGGELGHWVDVVGEGVEHLLDVSGETGTLGPLGGEGGGLLGGGDLASDQEPEEGLGEGLDAAIWCGWKGLLAIWNGHTTEADT